MILVFGGTTEGRKAVEVLEEAGSPYYYSTRSDGQQIALVNGIHLTGSMDVPQMISCCKEHGIRLMVDAAHPFAEELHHNLLVAAQDTGIPVIRYDRIYPPHTPDLVWCKDYSEALRQLETQNITRLLALTGVNTIGKLRPFWESHECWFRILNRRISHAIANKLAFPEDRLVYYETDDTSTLIHDLHPDAIITKESGLSGGFTEKVEAARQAGIKVFVVERPILPFQSETGKNWLYVNGPHGLRRAVEHLLPEFFPLHSGLTTGTCATAAAIAAILSTEGEVPVILPNGETIHVPVGYGEGYAYCIKEAGDDPDVTNGIEIRATVSASDSHGLKRAGGVERESPCKSVASVAILGGEGVGRFTLPGFDYPPGEAAINKGPREMIRNNIMHILETRPHLPLTITISVPNGAEIARRTFNPRLGIEGGISIIGVSGIVKPFSEEAFIDSIRKCMQVAKAADTNHVVINSGAKSERFLKARYPTLPPQAFVQYGNYIGETLKMATDLSIPNVTLGVMLGKAVKLADGHLDTHSRRATMDKDFVQQLLDEAKISIDLSTITLARELWEKIPENQLRDFVNVIIGHCDTYCRPLFPHGSLTILLIDDNGNIFEEQPKTVLA